MKRNTIKVLIVIILAIIIRVILASLIRGFETDIDCFSSWAIRGFEVGAGSFYEKDYFCDYLPGYVMILQALGAIRNLFSIADTSWVWILILKMPSIIADILLSIFAYKVSKKKLGEKASFIVLLIMAFNPLLIFNSSIWGQVDSIFILLIICVFYLFFKDKKILAGVIYGITILIKVQSLMIGPILAIIYIYDIVKKKDFKTVRNTILAVISALAVIFIISYPYKGDQNFFWIIEKAFSTTGGYPYITVNAANIYLVLFENWAPIEQTLLGIKSIVYGYIGIALSFIFSIIVFIKDKLKNRGTILFVTAIFMLCVYMIGPYMHERYLLIVPFLFLFAFIETKNKHFIWMSAYTGIICFINSIIVYIAYDTGNFSYLDSLNILSYTSIAIFILIIITTVQMLRKGDVQNERILEKE